MSDEVITTCREEDRDNLRDVVGENQTLVREGSGACLNVAAPTWWAVASTHRAAGESTLDPDAIERLASAQAAPSTS